MNRTDTEPQPLAAWRRIRGWTQAELGAHAAVSPSTIHRIEAHGANPRPGVARRLAAALGIDPGAVAELAEAIPRLGPDRAKPARPPAGSGINPAAANPRLGSERGRLAPHRDRPGGVVAEDHLPVQAALDRLADDGVGGSGMG